VRDAAIDDLLVENSLTSTFVTFEPAWAWWTLAGAIVALALVGVWIWRKGRPFAPGHVFHTSRFSRGNRLFPTQVLITPTTVVQYTPHWIGKQEESIHIAHISSVKINTGMFFSDVLIETSGGASPIPYHGT
jgi:predicted small integral membrane protein